MIKSIANFLIIFLYFSSLNLKYLKLTKMDITRFAMKLFIIFQEMHPLPLRGGGGGGKNPFSSAFCAFRTPPPPLSKNFQKASYGHGSNNQTNRPTTAAMRLLIGWHAETSYVVQTMQPLWGLVRENLSYTHVLVIYHCASIFWNFMYLGPFAKASLYKTL